VNEVLLVGVGDGGAGIEKELKPGGEVFGVVLVGAAAPNIGAEGIPIMFAEFGAGVGVAFFGSDNQRPAGVREVTLHEVFGGRRSGHWWRFFRSGARGQTLIGQSGGDF
jgi:hypothetical protein